MAEAVVEQLVRKAAATALDLQIDTLVNADSLAVRKSKLFFLTRCYYVTSAEFDDFYAKVYVNLRGEPKRTDIYIEK